MTELLEQGELTSLRGSPAHAQIVRRWVAVVLMCISAVLGLLYAFPDYGSWASSESNNTVANNYVPEPTPRIVLVALGVGITLGLVLPTIGLARRIRLRSARASWLTIVLGALVLVTTVATANSVQVLLFFLSCGVLMAIVGLPLSKFRPTS